MTASTHIHRSSLAPLAVGAVGVGLGGLLVAFDPNEAGHYPVCPFLEVTGHWCPGCGSLRAIRALAHADVGTALARNPLVVIAAPLLLWAWVRWLGTSQGWIRTPRRVAPPWVLPLLVAAIVSFWLLRNVPGWTWLSPE